MADFTYDVAIAGAGPAGSVTARQLAERGHRVLVLEEHQAIGAPCHCSGLVTPRTLDLAGVGHSVVLSEKTGAVFHAPSARRLSVGGDRVRALTIDRVAFDVALATSAQAAGAELRTATRLVSYERSKGLMRIHLDRGGKRETVVARLVVGADGAQSRVARQMSTRRMLTERLVGYGIEMRLASPVDPSYVHVFAGRRIAPGFFGWLIPLDAMNVRVGIATATGHVPAAYLERLIRGHPELFAGAEISSRAGGVISLHKLNHIVDDGVMLVGDAAGHVKPTSGGGIYTALRGATLCGSVASNALSRDELDMRQLRPYEARWQRAMGRELDTGRTLRKGFQRLSDAEIDTVFASLSTPAMQRLIARYGDIDFPSRLAAKVIWRTPMIWVIRRLISLGHLRVLGSSVLRPADVPEPGLLSG